MDRLVAEAPETGEGLLELDGSQIVRPLMPGFARGSSAYAAPSPFEQTQFFGAAVLADGVGGVPQVGNYATFVLDPSLFVVADGASISDVRVDLGTGAGYQPVTLGQPISASYPSARRVTGRVRARIGGVVRYAAFTFDAGAATTARLASDGPPPDIASRPVAR